MKRQGNSKFILKAMLLVFAFSLGGCIKRSNKNSSSPASPNEVVTPSQSAFQLVDPETVKITVSATKVEEKEFSKKFKLPTFTIQASGNDYVKVLRCQESYREYLEYMIAQVEQKEANTRNDRKWVWVDSFGNAKFCKVASSRYNANEFQDLGAKNGTFFYLVNPCVSAELSATGKDECSHHLALTNTITYKDSPSGEFLAKSAELADAESEYDAILSRLLGLSRAVMNQKEACEFHMAQVESARNVDNAGWQVLSLAIGVGAALGVRALLSRRVMHSMADRLSDLSKRVNKTYSDLIAKSGSILKTIGNGSSFNKNLYTTAGFFVGSLAIITLIRSAISNRGSGATHTSCEKADALASQILKIQEDKLLEKARDKMINLSQELARIDATFQGYAKESFVIPISAPAP